jgi:hypothetical protein
MREPPQSIETRRIGGKLRIEIRAGHNLAAQSVQVQRVLPFHNDRHADDLLRIRASDVGGMGRNRAIGSGQDYTLLSGGAHREKPPEDSAILPQNERRSGQRTAENHPAKMRSAKKLAAKKGGH